MIYNIKSKLILPSCVKIIFTLILLNKRESGTTLSSTKMKYYFLVVITYKLFVLTYVFYP